MIIHLKIVEADNIPKMDLIGKADPYVEVKANLSKDKDKTKWIDKTYTPRWDKEMHLRIISLEEVITFTLKDHDAVGSDNKIGTLEWAIFSLEPGVVVDNWYSVTRAKNVKKTARIRIIYHLAYDNAKAFVNNPFKLGEIGVLIENARDIAKMDLIGKSDPYCIVYIKDRQVKPKKTRVAKNTLKPEWNEEFRFEILNQTTDVLRIKMYDKDLVNDDEMATLDIPLSKLKPYKIVDKEYQMTPAKGVKKGGVLKLKIQIVPYKEDLWKDYSYEEPLQAPPSSTIVPPLCSTQSYSPCPGTTYNSLVYQGSKRSQCNMPPPPGSQYNMPSYPPPGSQYNMPSYPPPGSQYNMPSYPPHGSQYNMPPPPGMPPSGMAPPSGMPPPNSPYQNAPPPPNVPPSANPYYY